jgi:hypothetical protein
MPTTLREHVLQIVRGQYADFGPTLAYEKLVESHGVRLSVETLRQWMIADGIWRSRKQRAAAPHPPRRRRACLGELIQIDGCDHEWFEQRAPRCVLLVFIDDATGRLMQLLFTESESTYAAPRGAHRESTRALRLGEAAARSALAYQVPERHRRPRVHAPGRLAASLRRDRDDCRVSSRVSDASERTLWFLGTATRAPHSFG